MTKVLVLQENRVCEAIESPVGRSTLSVKRIRRRGRVRKREGVGVPDPSLTGFSGVAAVAELVDRLDVLGRLDRGIGSIKARDRGASAGELLVAMAQSQLLGADALVGLDRQRVDVGVSELSAVPVLASTTAAGLARRFGPRHLAGLEAAVADLTGRAVAVLPPARRVGLASAVTVDLDSTDVGGIAAHVGELRACWVTR